jgi:hypothetical protein
MLQLQMVYELCRNVEICPCNDGFNLHSILAYLVLPCPTLSFRGYGRQVGSGTSDIWGKAPASESGRYNDKPRMGAAVRCCY